MRIPKNPARHKLFYLRPAQRTGGINFLEYLSPEQMVTSTTVQVEYATGEFAIDPRKEKNIDQMFAQIQNLAL